jgi:hypothetical protein
MSRIVRLSLLAAVTTALVACGGGEKIGGGKEGAAKAMFDASKPAGEGGRSNGQSLMQQMAAGAATGSVDFKVDCAKSGSVHLKLDLTAGNQAGTIRYATEYKDCNQDGVNSFNGTMTVDFDFAGLVTPPYEMSMHLKGKIEISGDIDDYIDADITESITATAIGASSGAVTFKLNGTIKTSESSYTYANESVTITVEGSIPADNSGKS